MSHVDDPRKSLAKAGRQLLETERLLGAQFLPAKENPLPEMTPPAEPADAQPPASSVPADQKAAALARIDADEVKPCQKCELCRLRTNTVFGEGSADSDLVFVGEGPGQEEDRTGRPFVGRAGELLTKMIAAMGLARGDVFICNVIKCRAPGNRSPAPQEVHACWDYLVRQLQIIEPKVIVTLGNPATQSLLDTRMGITKMRGQWQQLPLIGEGLAGIPVMPTFHPAYLLRNYSVEARGKVWSDLQQVMEHLGIVPPGKNV